MQVFCCMVFSRGFSLPEFSVALTDGVMYYSGFFLGGFS